MQEAIKIIKENFYLAYPTKSMGFGQIVGEPESFATSAEELLEPGYGIPVPDAPYVDDPFSLSKQ